MSRWKIPKLNLGKPDPRILALLQRTSRLELEDAGDLHAHTQQHGSASQSGREWTEFLNQQPHRVGDDPRGGKMQCYNELTVPTAVTHSLCLPFISPASNNIVVAKSSLLQVFFVRTSVAPTNTSNAPIELKNAALYTKPQDRVSNTKLVLVAQYELAGIITSLERVKIATIKSGAEAILVGLRDAKLALIEWDPDTYSISTISLHFYEKEHFAGAPWDRDLARCPTNLTVDPSGKCAAFTFAKGQLAMLLFRQPGDDPAMQDSDGDDNEERRESNPTPAEAASQYKMKSLFDPSFTRPLTNLDPDLTNPIHLAFLHGYRVPTIGILYSQSAGSSNLLRERKDAVLYSIYTLDVEHKESTCLLTVNKLPHDLEKIIPVSGAAGGALLVGDNELIHVDQSGKTNGVAVNEMAKTSTSFPLIDQSDLEVKLERCVIKQLSHDSTDLLLILNNGLMAIVSFKIDGRTVSGLSVSKVKPEKGGDVILAEATCASIVGRGRMFVGSEVGNSVILGWSQSNKKRKRRRSSTDTEIYSPVTGVDIDADASALEDEDDLYAGDKDSTYSIQESTTVAGDRPLEYSFRIHDSMLNVGELKRAVCIPQDSKKPKEASLEIVATSGEGRAGSLTIFQPEIKLREHISFDIAGAQAVWSVDPKKTSEHTASSSDTDKYILVSRVADGQDKTDLYAITKNKLEEVLGTDLDPDAGKTVEVGTLNDGTRIAQILAHEVRVYDSNMGLGQIYPLVEEEMQTHHRVISANFGDPYVVIFRDDGGVIVLKADDSGELDEVGKVATLKDTEWVCGSIFEDSNDVFDLDLGEAEEMPSIMLLFLLSRSGGLSVFRLPSLRGAIYSAEGLSLLPPFLSPDFSVRRAPAKETIVEMLVADIGDGVKKSAHLILLTKSDDIVIYKPFHSTPSGPEGKELRFLKIPNPKLPKVDALDTDELDYVQNRRLRAVQDLNGYDAVFVAGACPSIIIKSAATPARVYHVAGPPILHASQIPISDRQNGIISVDEKGTTMLSALEPSYSYTTGLPSTSIHFGESISTLAYHSKSSSLILSTSTASKFKLPEDDQHHERWSTENSTFLPILPTDRIILVDYQTRHLIDSYAFEPYEEAIASASVSLEVSEITHERRECIAVGTFVDRGEDLAAQGRVYIFAIIDVVPEPDRPESGKRLKLLAREEVRGVVSALGSIGSQGLLFMAQGQRCMVRGLKEDGTFLPVAFQDCACLINVAKSLSDPVGIGKSLCLVGDLEKGIQLVGYKEEPYSLRQISKSQPYNAHPLEVIAADFLPSEEGKSLYIIVGDADCNLHVLQFDPENPRSDSGTRLLHVTRFHVGQFASTITLLPTAPPRSVLVTYQTGLISVLTPLPEKTHSMLTSLQSHTLSTLKNPNLGTNYRSFRAGALPVNGWPYGSGSFGMDGLTGTLGMGLGVGAFGGVIDGTILRKWGDCGTWKLYGAGGLTTFGGTRVGGAHKAEILNVMRSALGGGWMGRKMKE